jgi:hypothetical protein
LSLQVIDSFIHHAFIDEVYGEVTELEEKRELDPRGIHSTKWCTPCDQPCRCSPPKGWEYLKRGTQPRSREAFQNLPESSTEILTHNPVVNQKSAS